MTAEYTLEQILADCSTVFPENSQITPEFVEILSAEGLKTAYRQRVIEIHPDKARQTGESEILLTEKFKQLTEAYNNLLPVVERKVPVAESNPEVRTSKNTGAYKTASWDGFHRGGLPARRLRFAEFLYYRGQIPWQTVFDCLRWQREQRPILGRLAVEKGVLTHAELSLALREALPGEPLGASALRLGLISAFQLMALLGAQARFAVPAGRFFLEKGLLSPQGLDAALREFRMHNFSVAGRFE